MTAEIQKELQLYWSFGDEIETFDEITMKGKGMIISAALQRNMLNHLYMKHLGIEKTRMLVHKSIYWININAGIEDTVENCHTGLDFQATQPKEKTISHKIPDRMWESVGADIFTITNKQYLCIVDYQSKFPMIKQVKAFSADKII